MNNLIPIGADQYGNPVLFQHNVTGQFYVLTQNGTLVESDQNGNPIQRQVNQYDNRQMGYGNNNFGNSGFNNNYMPQGVIPKKSTYAKHYGAQVDKYANQQNGYGGLGSNMGSYGGNTTTTTTKQNRFGRYNNNNTQQDQYQQQQYQQQQQQQEVVVNEPVSNMPIIKDGYKPVKGSEFIPLYNEENEDLDVIVDENKKEYKFIIVKKG